MELATPLGRVLRTTNDHLDALKGLGIETVGQLLLYFPRAHEDLTQVQTASGAQVGEKVTLRGVLGPLKFIRTRSKISLLQAPFTDSEGTTIELVWFNQPHIQRMLKQGDELLVTGKLSEKGSHRQMQSPQFDRGLQGKLVHAGKLVPVYPQHDILNTKWLREKMQLVREAVDKIEETLPPEVVESEKLPTRAEMVRCLHFPDTPADVERALERLTFEEAYALQQEALERKLEWQGERQERLKIPMDVALIRAFFASLKFTPTDDQRKAIYEILRDMEEGVPMSRLLEGDVGSGKTLVATAVIANVLRHGGQAALMVPTEVLARQHAQSVTKSLLQFHATVAGKQADGGEPIVFRQPVVALLTGSTPAAQADEIKRSIATGTVDLVIGTHALIEDTVQFKNLTLVVVDEQHRFGVAQRTKLKEKGNPHFLTMTATPIPRTLALTAFGHHDLSVLLSKPKDRLPIKTRVVAPADRVTVERFIDKQVEEGRQVFVICPLISESEADEMQEIKNVEQEVARLRIAFPHRRVSSLHGKLVPKEKESIMQEFRDRKADILVSTSVIEVGVDVPNASIMIIEGAERFGLSQLHQFRGRVGRGEHQSYCFLFPTTREQADSKRLLAMEQYDSGFQLAEIDLQLRGPGELFGLRQSGIPDIRVSTLLRPEVIVRARRAAERHLGLRTGREAA